MEVVPPELSLFSDKGRRLVTMPYRVFAEEELGYYHIKERDWTFEEIAARYNEAGHLGFEVDAGKFKAACTALERKFLAIGSLSSLFNGVKVPFIIPKIDIDRDLASSLIIDFLDPLEASFRAAFPLAHFKAVMQGGATLENNLRVTEHSRYEQLLSAAAHGPVVGWYFPQALQQFDTDSQARQMQELPTEDGLCLSGPLEMIHAVMGRPNLLINEDGYAPILCMSSVRHLDGRLALVLKAYGPHLEFWCLSQMLAPDVFQVSEQWAGGITLYRTYSPADSSR